MSSKVSIIIPIYNAEKHLAQCIESAMNQTLKDIEIILIDDGSKDGSAKICKKYVELDNRVSYYYKENEGLAAARQDGIDRSSGEFIGFIDSDDWVEPDMYERMYNAAKSNDSDIVLCDCYINENEPTLPLGLRYGSYDRKQIEEEVFPHLLISVDDKKKRHNTRWSNCLRIYKRELIEEHGISFGRKFRRCQDLPFTFDCTKNSQNYYCLEGECLYHNRQEPGSLSRGYTKNMFSLIKPLMEYLYKSGSECKDYNFTKYLDTTSFFLASDCIENEFRKGAPNGFKRYKKLKEIFTDPFIKQRMKKLSPSMFNYVYRPVCKHLKNGSALTYILYVRWNKSHIRKCFYKFVDVLTETSLYKKLRGK